MPPMNPKKSERHCPTCGTAESKTPSARARKAVSEAESAKQQAMAERQRMTAQRQLGDMTQNMGRAMGQASPRPQMPQMGRPAMPMAQPMGGPRPQAQMNPAAAQLVRAMIQQRMRQGR